jgi:hypothetical protein
MTIAVRPRHDCGHQVAAGVTRAHQSWLVSFQAPAGGVFLTVSSEEPVRATLSASAISCCTLLSPGFGRATGAGARSGTRGINSLGSMAISPVIWDVLRPYRGPWPLSVSGPAGLAARKSDNPPAGQLRQSHDLNRLVPNMTSTIAAKMAGCLTVRSCAPTRFRVPAYSGTIPPGDLDAFEQRWAPIRHACAGGGGGQSPGVR